jgi:hypothetical protein
MPGSLEDFYQHWKIVLPQSSGYDNEDEAEYFPKHW